MHRFLSFLVILMCFFNLAFTSSHTIAEDSQVFISSNLEAYSDSFNLYDLYKSKFTEHKKGDVTYAFFTFKSGAKYQTFSVAFLKRVDMLAEYNGDTSELIYSSKSDAAIDKNRRFNVDLAVSHIDSKGIEFGYDWQLNSSFRVQVESQILYAKRVTNGSLNGVVDTFSESYEGDLVLDYIYTKDAILGRKPEKHRGQGVALNLNMHWRIDDKNEFELKVKDLYHKVEWDNLTFTEANLSRRPIRFDEEGKINAKPSLKGFEGNTGYSISLPTRTYFTWRHQFPKASTFGAIAIRFFSLSYIHQQLSLIYTFKTQPHWYFTANTDRAFGLGYQVGNIQLYLSSDRLNLQKSKSLSSNLLFQFSF